MIEIRWHGRGGQGAKTAAHLFALAEMRAGKSVQAFPEYGPERRGAPVRAFNRFDDAPIRRHDAVTSPTAVVVLDPSLIDEPAVFEGLGPDGLVLADVDDPAARDGGRIVAVPAARLAESSGTGYVNLVMAGALAGALGEPSLQDVEDAAVELLGRKADPDALRSAVREGYEWLT